LIFKLIVFAIVALLIYRFFGGELPKFGRSLDEKKLDEDTLVECTKCGTYVTMKESRLVRGSYYCEECA